MDQQHEPEDEYGFWRDEPTALSRITQRLPRVRSRQQPTVRRPAAPARPAGTRSHDDTQTVPVVDAPAGVANRVRESMQHVDPLLRRVGALAVIIALCVPVALATRGSAEETGQRLEGAAAAAAPAGDATTATQDGATETTWLDPRSLPPATPVAGWDDDSSPSSAADSSTTDSPGTAASTDTPSIQATPARTQALPAASCAKDYEVAPGDYWILIASKVSVSLADLLAANGADPDTPLYPGSTICLPAGASTPTTLPAAKVTATTVKPTTTTAKPTTTTAAPRNYTRAEVEAIIRSVWPDDLENEAIRIAIRESNLIPTAHNSCCHGLFQIYFSVHRSWLGGLGITTVTQLYDPLLNAKAALVLYQRAGGWGPWQ